MALDLKQAREQTREMALVNAGWVKGRFIDEINAYIFWLKTNQSVQVWYDGCQFHSIVGGQEFQYGLGTTVRQLSADISIEMKQAGIAGWEVFNG